MLWTYLKRIIFFSLCFTDGWNVLLPSLIQEEVSFICVPLLPDLPLLLLSSPNRNILKERNINQYETAVQNKLILASIAEMKPLLTGRENADKELTVSTEQSEDEFSI